MLTVVALYRAKPGEGDAVAAALAEHVVATRAEPGCIQFDACRSTEDGDDFVLFEKYEDEAAFQDHRASAHFERYIVGRVAPRLEERTWRLYDPIGGA